MTFRKKESLTISVPLSLFNRHKTNNQNAVFLGDPSLGHPSLFAPTGDDMYSGPTIDVEVRGEGRIRP